MPKNLKIYLLGNLLIELNGQSLTGLPSRAAEALLIYLACHERPVARDLLADLLWEGRSQKQGLTNLRTVLAALRRQIADHLLITRQTLGFNHDADYWLDVVEFENHLMQLKPQLQSTAPLSSDTASCLQAALDLYQGDFLAGFSLREGFGFEEWTLLKREQLRHLAGLGLRRIVEYYLATGDYQLGLRNAERLLALNPYDDQARRQMMWLLVRSGQRQTALKQYQTYRQLLAKDLDVEPAPETTRLYRRIKAAQTSYHNSLPCFSTPFVGRESELEQVSQYLADPHCRLLTLIGPGGIGKTRLAVETATRQHHNFLHGVCFVPLASLQSGELLVAALTNLLNLSLDAASDPQAQLLNALQERELLLVLDNFEHLLSSTDSAPEDAMNPGLSLLLDVLNAAPDVKLLVTSRERLNLHEEWVFRVRGLAVPADTELETATAYSAVQLFIKNAAGIQTDFVPTREEMEEIIRICRQVEGMPLGIQLAAAWVRGFSCREIADEIEHDLTLLHNSARNAPPRHRSIEVVFDHSWDLLTSTEQQILSRLSVFQGGFTRAAAQQVAGATGPILNCLVDKSWLSFDPEGKYEFHDLLRRYAAGKLNLNKNGQPPEMELSTPTRHAEYYAAFLQERQPTLEGQGQVEALAEITEEIGNVRAAWQWTIAEERTDLLGSALESLWRFYEIKGWFHEGLEAFGQAVERLDRSQVGQDCSVEKSTVFAQLLIRYAWFAYRLARFDRARDLLEQGLKLARRVEDHSEIGRALHHLGIVAYLGGQYVEAKQHLEESLAVYDAFGGSHFDVGSSTASLGFVLWKLEQFDKAKSLIQQGMFHYQQTDDPRAIALMYSFLGGFSIEQGDYTEAKRLLLEGLTFQRRIDDQVMIRMSLTWLGEVYEKRGDYAEAKRQYEESLQISRGNGDRMGIVTALNHLGRMSVDLGEHRSAKSYLKDALTMAGEIQYLPFIIDGLISVASLLAQQDDSQRAIEILVPLLDHPAGEPHTRARAEQLLARLTRDSSVTIPAETGPLPALETLVPTLLADGLLSEN